MSHAQARPLPGRRPAGASGPPHAARGGAWRASARAAALLVLCAAAACGDDEAPVAASGGGFRIPVTWAAAAPGEVTETVELVGDVLSSRWARLAFERAGRIVEVKADLGDAVTEGQVLARLDDDVIARDLDVARALVESAKVDFEFTDRESRRAAEAGSDVLSASELDRRRAAAASAKARLAQREAEVARLEEVLSQGRLHAPFDGIVASREVTLGSYAAVGQPAFTLVDMAHREVHLEVPAPVATRMTLGGRVELRVDGMPDLVVTGKMDELVPTASLASRSFTGVVRLDGLPGTEHLLPGMFARARFAQTVAESRTVVPMDAVLEDALGARVVVMDAPQVPGAPAEDGGASAPVARIVPVRVLASDGRSAAVEPLQADALRAGDRVVVTGADNVFPGAQLAPVAHGPEGAPGAGGAGAAADGAPGASEASEADPDGAGTH